MGRHLLSGAWRLSDAFLQHWQFASPTVNSLSAQFSCIQRSRTSSFQRRGFRLDTILRAQPRDFNRDRRTIMSSGSQGPAEGQASTAVPAIESLSLHSTTEQSKFPNCFPSLNPVDIYREHIAENLGQATGIDPLKIYQRLAWTSTLDKGDLVLPV